MDYTVDANTGEVGHIAGDLDIAALVDVADDLQWYPNDGTPDVGEWTENDVDTNVGRSEEHTSELQSHSFISYAVFCLKKKITFLYLLSRLLL